jgi:hypothetical protein
MKFGLPSGANLDMRSFQILPIPADIPKGRKDRREHMGRRILVLLLLVLVASAIISCGGQTTPQNQPTDQPVVQLSPKESQAKQTVTDFLDMCKGGQIQEAINEYVDPASDFRTTFAKVVFKDIRGFSFGDITSDTSFSPGVILLNLNVEVPDSAGIGGVGESPIQFSCTEDGSHILNVNYSPEVLKKDTQEEDQAKQVAASFLDLCKQGQVQEAIDKYVELRPGLALGDTDILNDIVDYTIGDASTDASLAKISVDVSLKRRDNAAETPVELWLNQDGKTVFQVVGPLQVIHYSH